LFDVEFGLLEILIAQLSVIEIQLKIFEISEYLFLSQIFEFEKVILEWVLLFLFHDCNLQLSSLVDMGYFFPTFLLQLLNKSTLPLIKLLPGQ
jgi:hypothetical protein